MHEFVSQANECLEQSCEVLRWLQLKTEQDDMLFTLGEIVWLESRHRKKDSNSKLQPKFVGPQIFSNLNYLIQLSIQNECRLKPYIPEEPDLAKCLPP